MTIDETDIELLIAATEQRITDAHCETDARCPACGAAAYLAAEHDGPPVDFLDEDGVAMMRRNYSAELRCDGPCATPYHATGYRYEVDFPRYEAARDRCGRNGRIVQRPH